MKEGAGLFFDFGGTLMDPVSDKLAHTTLMEALREKYIIEPPARHLQTYFDTYFRSLYKQRELIWPAPESTYRIVFDDMMSRFWGRPSDDEFDWFMAKYKEMHVKHVKLLPGINEVLTGLKTTGIPLGIISDADTDYLDYQLAALGILDIFSTVTTSQEVGVGKPNKKIFNLAMEKSGCAAANSLYIGDNYERDVIGSREAGMTAILLLFDDKAQIPDGEDGNVARSIGALKPMIAKFFV